jgi:hypothetical protein
LAAITDRARRFEFHFARLLGKCFDSRTPEGEPRMALWASIAQMERARIKDRTEGRRKALRAAGKFVEGLPAFGYKRAQACASSDKPRRIEIDPPRAAIVREMFDLCIRGYSTREISRHMRARYTDCRFGHAWIGRALKNRVYAGQLALTPVRPHNHCAGIMNYPATRRFDEDPIGALLGRSRFSFELCKLRVERRDRRVDVIKLELACRYGRHEALASCCDIGSPWTEIRHLLGERPDDFLRLEVEGPSGKVTTSRATGIGRVPIEV